jgi:hypothetical protein
LRKDDLFIFLMTPLQKTLLKEFGSMVATDGTHSVFAYNNIKLISVHVTSFKPGDARGNPKERGFPIAIVLTVSEREEIHKAIATMLRSAVPEWMPELLMTDMAFSAFNGWSTLFPSLSWLWCVFHVWQAWIRRLRSMPNSGGFDKDVWSHLKGLLIKEVKELICSKSEVSGADFEQRATLIGQLLHALGATEIAGVWETYVSRRERWAQHERRAIIARIFGAL